MGAARALDLAGIARQLPQACPPRMNGCPPTTSRSTEARGEVSPHSESEANVLMMHAHKHTRDEQRGGECRARLALPRSSCEVPAEGVQTSVRKPHPMAWHLCSVRRHGQESRGPPDSGPKIHRPQNTVATLDVTAGNRVASGNAPWRITSGLTQGLNPHRRAPEALG